MGSPRMIHLTSVQGPFHARVVVARLGAEGILTELRPPVDGPYPVYRPVDVYVSEEDSDVARELLLADEVEDALSAVDEDGWPTSPDEGRESHRSRNTWILVAALVALAALSFAHLLS